MLRRGEALSAANQLIKIRRAAAQLALVANGNELVLTHGNGLRVGLGLQSAAYSAVDPYPLDVLRAQTDGMIGYLLEQELNNLLPSRVIATLLTRIEVSLADPAFAAPAPQRVLGLQPIEWLLARGALVIAAGGGGIPVAADASTEGRILHGLHGVEAVIEKDACSSQSA